MEVGSGRFSLQSSSRSVETQPEPDKMKRFYLVNIFLDLIIRTSCLSSHSCLLAAYLEGLDMEEWTCTQSTSQHACIVKDRQSLIAKFGEAVGQVIPIPPTMAVCGKGQDESRDCRYTKANLKYSALRLEWGEWSGTGYDRIRSSKATDGQDSLPCPHITSDNPPYDCAVIYRQGERQSGVYTIYPQDGAGIQVYCDMLTAGGGWTVFHKRYNGQLSFKRLWEAYAVGFGDPGGEYWLGLRHVHDITETQSTELYVGLTDYDVGFRYARYGTFHVANELDKFRLTVENYSGNGGDSLGYHNGELFSTPDQDNDKSTGHCAGGYHTAWWFKHCYMADLNGQYAGSRVVSESDAYMQWYHLQNQWISLKAAFMMMRPASFII